MNNFILFYKKTSKGKLSFKKLIDWIVRTDCNLKVLCKIDRRFIDGGKRKTEKLNASTLW